MSTVKLCLFMNLGKCIVSIVHTSTITHADLLLPSLNVPQVRKPLQLALAVELYNCVAVELMFHFCCQSVVFCIIFSRCADHCFKIKAVIQKLGHSSAYFILLTYGSVHQGGLKVSVLGRCSMLFRSHILGHFIVCNCCGHDMSIMQDHTHPGTKHFHAVLQDLSAILQIINTQICRAAVKFCQTSLLSICQSGM